LIYATFTTVVKCTIAQLQRILFISSKNEKEEIGRQLIRLLKKRKSLHEIQPAISTAKIFCRFGAGHEEHVGVGDTPGFECYPNPSSTPEGHGFTKHMLFRSPRNNKIMVQTSMFLTQAWRGDVDGKPLLYQSDPSNPDPEDIVTCIDYLVGYQVKGAQTLAIEKKNMKYLVTDMEDMYGNKERVFSATRKLLNCASVDRTISKQEAMFLLAQLPLILCSYRIEPVSLYPSRRICNKIESKKAKHWKISDGSRSMNGELEIILPFPYWIPTDIKYYWHTNHGQNRILFQTNRVKPIGTNF
jgi:hypothetical protein